MSTEGRFDVIVVGGGHNGLVAAAYLARNGARPLVVEARHKTGGAADTMAPWPEAPGFKVTTLSYVMSLMPDTILRDLELGRHGYRGVPVGPYFVPFPDGRSIIQSDDAKADHDEFAKFAERDAEALERWEAWSGGLADVLGPLLMRTPPRLGSRSLGDVKEQVTLAWRHRGLGVRGVADLTRLMTMSVADIVDRFFESEQVKTVMALNGLIGTWAGPYEPGTGYVMAHHSIGDVGGGRLGSWATPIGGMGAVAAALESSARSLGAEIRTEAPVDRILTSSGAVRGVLLASGEEIAPFGDGVMPTFHDPTMAPEGKHVVSLFTQWCPAGYAEESHPRELDAYATRVIDGYDELAPGFKDSILHLQVIGPYEMEHEWGLIGGNIFHGELSAEQLFHMRPAPGYADYRTPIRGLYQCSSATHAGGGVSGIPAYNCVREIVKDRRAARRRPGWRLP